MLSTKSKSKCYYRRQVQLLLRQGFSLETESLVEGISKSMGRMFHVEECLAPRDQEINSGAKQMRLLAYTRQ